MCSQAGLKLKWIVYFPYTAEKCPCNHYKFTITSPFIPLNVDFISSNSQQKVFVFAKQKQETSDPPSSLFIAYKSIVLISLQTDRNHILSVVSEQLVDQSL